MNSNIISSYAQFVELKQYVETIDSPYLIIDTETNNKNERKAELWGIGLCLEDHEAFYIPIRKVNEEHFWSYEQENEIRQWIVSLASKKKLIGHNIIYDILVLKYNWDIDLTDYIYSDTILLKHTVDEERPHGLKETAVKYLGAWADKAQKDLYESIKINGGRTTKEEMDMYKADTDILGTYCNWDCLLTIKLFNLFEPRLKEEGLYDLFYKDEIMPLYKEVTIPMKDQGFPVDIPHFNQLKIELTKEIDKLEQGIIQDVELLTTEFTNALLDSDYPINNKGTFPKIYAETQGIPLPSTDGKVSLNKTALAAIIKIHPRHAEFYNWVQSGNETYKLTHIETMKQAQRVWFFKDNPDRKHIFNLKSNDHLIYLIYDKLGEIPQDTTETGKPKIDDDALEALKDEYDFIKKLVDFKKLNKLLSTYVDGILDRHIDGVIYTSMLQFGTTSGRYSSTNPNLQNIPRLKDEDSDLSPLVLKYVNSIKKGFIAGKGYKIVNADYSQLEPRAFAEASNEPLLQKVFVENEDLYGSIALRIFGLDCTANEVKKKYPNERQQAKTIALAIVYGSEAGRISQLLKISYEEAQEIIDYYLEAYPGLRDYMSSCDALVCKKGFVKTKFGRVRHLPEAKRLYDTFGMKLLNRRWAKDNGLDEVRWKFKNMLNLAKNFPIQGVAAHVVNRAAIAINREFKIHGIDGKLIGQTHDELTSVVREDQVELAASIKKRCMEQTTKLSIPLNADPLIADNWADAK